MNYYQNFKATHNLITSTFINYSSASPIAANTVNNAVVLQNKLLQRLHNSLSFLRYQIPNPPQVGHDLDHRFAKLVNSHRMESRYLINLRNYQPRYNAGSQVSVWHRLPAVRRSSVLVLLFLGRQGELRVILTKRSHKLRNFSGHISLPGGKVDYPLESEFQCSRREAEEEIGIHRDNRFLKEKFGYEVEELKVMPTYLARTLLGVSPCVAFINWSESKLGSIEDQHIGNIMLNPGESSSIFSVPLKDFLQPKPRRYELKECLKQSYIKTKWAGIPWNLRSFIFPIHNDNEVRWLEEIQDLSSESEDETQEDHEFGVRTRNCWGLTANILHDLAEIVYTGEKYYDNVLGEEDLIWALIQNGQMQTKQRSEFEKKLINNTKGCSFKECMSSEEFINLKNLYSTI
ncbi:hypothetical protein KL909_001078 [Ogataea angusta]|uniref:Nudix hydrolase domain-containing protein n=1 Tax=Pichia angusta TaxID=870730 RepID=A0AAN6DJ73_PICAN|nr:uncharacterized protein KL928_000353 [Ogataea angusta]KAG7821878.1 hypothetical protein KL928_000353 [Ogataea angusta]KAG7825846.1 hypothetical protein KL909_001078 [Ogataea angusta]